MDMMIEGLSAVLGIVILVVWYQVGKMENIIGLIFRTIWNFWFRILSVLPFLGWTSRFIITKDE